MKTYLIYATLLVLLSCNKPSLNPGESLPLGIPACVLQLIQQNGKNSTDAAFYEISRYTYQNRYVYLATAGCCDRFNVLFDDTCRAVCSPSGGIAGGGDGKCPGIFNELSDRKLIWQRPN